MDAHKTYNSEYIEQLLTDGSKRGFMASSDALEVLMKRSNGTFKFTELDEKIITDHVVFYMSENNFLFRSFERRLVQLVDSGIAQYIVDSYAYKQRSKNEDPRRVLTYNHLAIGFQIWLFFLFVAFLCFLLEFVPSIYRKFIVNFRVGV